ncbi:hypothetical protein V1477_012515 [Vespula maculifrons]|uniref:Uncharacterized protein n=1 Tax=Vespula maculifrons TaxID=7453 RepID=A0ABD2BXQ0_VESMC
MYVFSIYGDGVASIISLCVYMKHNLTFHEHHPLGGFVIHTHEIANLFACKVKQSSLIQLYILTNAN